LGKSAKTLKEIPRQHIAIWGADASGQLGREQEHTEKYHKIIGQYTKNNKPEKGNGVKLAQICQQQKMIPNEQMGKTQNSQTKKKSDRKKPTSRTNARRNTTKQTNNMDKPRRKNHKTTRLRNDKPQVPRLHKKGTNNRRMASQHDTTKTTQSGTNGYMSQTNEKLQKRTPQETGINIKYDIKELRNDPQKITRWIEQRTPSEEQNTEQTAEQEWQKLKEQITTAITENYPITPERKNKTCQTGQTMQNNGSQQKIGNSYNNT